MPALSHRAVHVARVQNFGGAGTCGDDADPCRQRPRRRRARMATFGSAVPAFGFAVVLCFRRDRKSVRDGGGRPRPPSRHRLPARNDARPWLMFVIVAQAAAEATAPLGTDEIVLRICEAIWYGSPCEFGRRSSR